MRRSPRMLSQLAAGTRRSIVASATESRGGRTRFPASPRPNLRHRHPKMPAHRPRIPRRPGRRVRRLGVVVSLVALGLGSAAGWWVVVKIFELDWAPDWGTVAATLALGAVVTLVLGLLGSLPALAARPARALREL